MDKEFWGEPISVYTDQQAVEDGFLVDISICNLDLSGRSLNRMTRHLWDEMILFIHTAADFLACKDKVNCRDSEHVSIPELKKILITKGRMASLAPVAPDARIITFPPDLWAVQNELGGYTLMFPSDY